MLAGRNGVEIRGACYGAPALPVRISTTVTPDQADLRPSWRESGLSAPSATSKRSERFSGRQPAQHRSSTTGGGPRLDLGLLRCHSGGWGAVSPRSGQVRPD